MLEIIAVIAVLLAIAIAVVLILAATRPDRFSIERTAIVNAPPEAIFPLIDDFHQWVAWSPYENRDPAMKRGYTVRDRRAASMKLPPFEYEAPTIVAEAIDLLAEHLDEASVLAGGQSLIPLLALRRPARRCSSTSTA